MRYLNIRNGQFTFIDKVMGPTIESRISIAGKRFLQWTPNGLTGERVCHDERQLPQGWTLAYDLDLELDQVPYRLTIQGGMINYGFKPYLADLYSRNIRLEHTVTRITIDDSRNGYASLKFEQVSKPSLF